MRNLKPRTWLRAARRQYSANALPPMKLPAMLDDLDHLRNHAPLLQLLGHYVELCEPDREAWQDRIMHLDGCEPRELTKMHGVLLGFGWLEQNTGYSSPPYEGGEGGVFQARACYRITAAGLRAFREVQGLKTVTEAPSQIERPRRKKRKEKETEAAGSA